MATLATQTLSRLGVSPTYDAAAGGGDVFSPSADTYVQIKNTGAQITATFATPQTIVQDLSITPLAVVIPATTGDKIIGPFPAEVFANATTGLCSLTYSSATGVTVGVFRLSRT